MSPPPQGSCRLPRSVIIWSVAPIATSHQSILSCGGTLTPFDTVRCGSHRPESAGRCGCVRAATATTATATTSTTFLACSLCEEQHQQGQEHMTHAFCACASRSQCQPSGCLFFWGIALIYFFKFMDALLTS